MLNKEKLRDNSDKSNDEDSDEKIEAPIDDDNGEVEELNDSINDRTSPPRLTQSNDVAWDWRSPGIDKLKIPKQDETFGTPRSTKLPRNKRNSNSPLMYKSIKRVLVKKETTNGTKSFRAELQALSNKLVSQNSGQSTSKSTENVDPTKDIIDNIDIDIDDFNDEIHLHENKANKNTGDDDKNKLDNNKKDDENINYDQLLNDSIDEVFMVQCSQEVEDKLKFEDKTSNKNVFTYSLNVNKNTASTSDLKKYEKVKNNNVVPLLLSNTQNRKNHEEQSSGVSTVLKPSTNVNLVTKEKSFPVNKTYGMTKTTAVIPTKLSSNFPLLPKSKPSSSTYQKPVNIKSSNNYSSSTNNTVSKESSINLPKPAWPIVETFEILDDDDHLFDNIELSSVVLEAQLKSKKSNQSTLNKFSSNQAQKTSVSTSESNTKPSTSGGHGKFQMKFFRSKSTPDSNVNTSNSKVTSVSSSSTIKTSNNTINGRKNLGESSKTSTLRSVSNNNLAISNTGSSSLSRGFNNGKICDSDRGKVKKDGDTKSSSGMQCTAEQIEQKRLEAQRRRAAKMNNMNTNNKFYKK